MPKQTADPYQTASEEAVWSGSSLYAIMASILWNPAILFENRKWDVQNFRTFIACILKKNLFLYISLACIFFVFHIVYVQMD